MKTVWNSLLLAVHWTSIFGGKKIWFFFSLLQLEQYWNSNHLRWFQLLDFSCFFYFKGWVYYTLHYKRWKEHTNLSLIRLNYPLQNFAIFDQCYFFQHWKMRREGASLGTSWSPLLTFLPPLWISLGMSPCCGGGWPSSRTLTRCCATQLAASSSLTFFRR